MSRGNSLFGYMQNSIKNIFSNQFIQAVLFILVLLFLYEVRLIITLLFLAFILMSGFRPVVDFLTKRKVPRFIAIIIPYILVGLVLAAAAYTIIPVLVSQLQALVVNLPAYSHKIGGIFGTRARDLIQTNVSGIVGNLSNTLIALPGIVFDFSVSFFTVIVISIYLLWEWTGKRRKEFLLSDTAENNSLNTLIQQIEHAMGSWFRGQLLLSLSLSIMVWIGLTLLRVEFPLALGVFAGFMELVPFIGPIISAAAALIIAANTSLLKVGLVFILFFIIQQIEGNVLVPQIMRRSIHLHPIVIIVVILLGTHFMGILGAIIAVPVVTILALILEYIGSPLGKILTYH